MIHNLKQFQKYPTIFFASQILEYLSYVSSGLHGIVKIDFKLQNLALLTTVDIFHTKNRKLRNSLLSAVSGVP